MGGPESQAGAEEVEEELEEWEGGVLPPLEEAREETAGAASRQAEEAREETEAEASLPSVEEEEEMAEAALEAAREEEQEEEMGERPWLGRAPPKGSVQTRTRCDWPSRPLLLTLCARAL